MSSESLAHLHIGNVEIRCDTPYNPAFVEDLKRTLRFPDRKWDADDKIWIISLQHEQTIVDLCRKHYGDVHVVRPKRTSDGTQSRPSSSAIQTPYDVLHVKPTAPAEVIGAAYRALARKYHPDVSGSPDAHQRMQELNSAYQQIEVRE